MDPRAADRGIWDSAPKEVAEETDTFVAGPRKYLNTNPRFNPQYDFLGMKRFGLKPLVVAIPFWTQDDGRAEVSEERVIGEVGAPDLSGSAAASASTTSTTTTSLYAYTIMKEKTEISELTLYQSRTRAENKNLISNQVKTADSPVIDAKIWPRTPKIILPGVDRTYTRQSTSLDNDVTMTTDTPKPHARLSHETAYSTDFPLPAGITGNLKVFVAMYAGTKQYNTVIFSTVDKSGNAIVDVPIPVHWEVFRPASLDGTTITIPVDAVAGRFSIPDVATHVTVSAEGFVGDFYVTHTETKTSTTTAASGTTTSTTGSSGAGGRDAAVAWARNELLNNPGGYLRAGMTYCEEFTRKAFGNTTTFYADAWANASANTVGNHLQDAVLGDLVFFIKHADNKDHGHVAIISKIVVGTDGKKNYFMIGAVNSGLQETSVNQNDYWRGKFYGYGTGEKSYGDGVRTKRVSATVTSPASGIGPPSSGTKTVIVDRVMKEAVSDEISTLLDDCNQWMYDTLRQMDKCYAGKIRIIGNPFIKVGMELVIDDDETNNYSAQKSFKNRNSVNYSQIMEKSTDTLSDKKDTRERYYVESVHHSWSVFPRPNFVTELGLTRGIFVSGKDVPFEIGDKGGFAAANSAYGAQAVKKLSQAEKDVINPPLVTPIAEP